MTWATAFFIIGIVFACNIGWVINNWIRAKHGYPLEDEWGGTTEKVAQRDDNELRDANQKLLQTMEKMQDRMIVLERIVTDKGYTVAEEIEALRDNPRTANTDSGVPLDINAKEKA